MFIGAEILLSIGPPYYRDWNINLQQPTGANIAIFQLIKTNCCCCWGNNVEIVRLWNIKAQPSQTMHTKYAYRRSTSNVPSADIKKKPKKMPYLFLKECLRAQSERKRFTGRKKEQCIAFFFFYCFKPIPQNLPRTSDSVLICLQVCCFFSDPCKVMQLQLSGINPYKFLLHKCCHEAKCIWLDNKKKKNKQVTLFIYVFFPSFLFRS